MLDKNGVNDYMINIGGELRSKGKNHFKDSFWKIGIENPEKIKMGMPITKKIQLNNISIASSEEIIEIIELTRKVVKNMFIL